VIHAAPGTAPAPGPEWLAATYFLDSDHPRIRAFAEQAAAGAASDVARAVKLFYAVRDGWRYDPFTIRLGREHYVASAIHAGPAAYCIPKAVLLAAAARAIDIPAGIGLSDVVNHLTTAKLREKMGGNTLFVDHGYAVLHVNGKWVKAAPAFNIELCERFHVRPTEFDGFTDAVFQEFDALDRRHMEYVADHGIWSDLPFERIIADMQRAYPPTLFTDEPADTRFEDQTPLTG
jgi:transglutaminase-like putative cysteine protease